MINLRKLIIEVMTLLKIKANMKAIELKIKIDSNIPEKFYTEPNRLK
jgi:hypothetical protein